jgi:hypothetical protein
MRMRRHADIILARYSDLRLRPNTNLFAARNALSLSAARPAARHVAVLAIAAVLLLSLAMTKRLDHDEHQFIASSALLARRGLLPYRDYPYFHTPYLVWIDAAVFRFSDHLLLSARLISALCGWCTAAIIYFATLHLFKHESRGERFAIACAALTLLLANPVFAFTTGRAWNHDLPTMLTLLAFFAAIRGARDARAAWPFLAGMLMGISIGTRLTFAPPAIILIAPFFLAPNLSRRQRAVMALSYIAGLALALLPLLAIASLAPRQFIFGNFIYPTLNTAMRSAKGYAKSMGPAGKISFVLSDVLIQPVNLFALAFLAILIILAARRTRRHCVHQLEIQTLVVLNLSMLVAAMAPTPLFLPYFFTPAVFLILLGVYLLAEIWRDRTIRPKVGNALVAAVILCGGFGIAPHLDRGRAWKLNEWTPMNVHEQGLILAQHLPRKSRVLTVTPIIPLEGRADIFAPMATGAFALRIAPTLETSEARSLRVLSAQDAAKLFWQTPGAAILTGSDPTADKQLLSAIGEDRLWAQPLWDNCILWTPRTPMPLSFLRAAPLR